MTVSTNTVSAGDSYDTVAEIILQTRFNEKRQVIAKCPVRATRRRTLSKVQLPVILEILFSDRTTAARLLTANENSQPVNVNKKLAHSLSLTVP